jgi:hypothetical protein
MNQQQTKILTGLLNYKRYRNFARSALGLNFDDSYVRDILNDIQRKPKVRNYILKIIND